MSGGKKGQATLFIILGIIVLIFIISAIIASQKLFVIDSFSREVNDIKNAIESCNKDIAKECLILLGLQSGRYKNFYKPVEQADDYYDFGKFYISHLAYLGSLTEFTLGDVEKEFNEYYNDKLPECLDYFDAYKKRGYSIEPKGMNMDVEFLDEITIFTLTYEVIASKGGKTEILKEYVPAEIPFRFKKMFDVATEAAELHASTGSIPLNYILSNGLRLINYRVGHAIIYRMVDQKDDEERRYVFYFAVS